MVAISTNHIISVPFSVILGEDEIALGKVKIKENSLPKEHPEKTGVLVDIDNLVAEVRKRLTRKAAIDSMTKVAGGLRVVGGIKGEPEKMIAAEGVAAEPVVQETSGDAAAVSEETSKVNVGLETVSATALPEVEKVAEPAGEIGAKPA